MQKSTTATEHLIIRAFTHSEWDNCAFAIMHISDSYRKELAKRLSLMEHFEKNTDLYNHTYWDSPSGYFVSDELIQDVLDDSEDWAFVELSSEEMETFEEPETKLGCHTFELSRYGAACFRAFGEYSNELFGTAEFRIREVLDRQ